MSKFYVTKKQVNEYIASRPKALGISEEVLLYEANKALLELEVYPKENPAMIRFFKRVVQTLSYNINKSELKNSSLLDGKVEYHRNPTYSEIKFGEGAIHYKDFDVNFCIGCDGNLKKWLVCPIDGLRYYR